MEGFEPRPRASQTVAAAKRARPTHDTEPIEPLDRPSRAPLAAGAIAIIVLMLGMASYQLAQAPARPLQLAPTRAPAQVFAAPPTTPTTPPAATTAPTATIAPTARPVPTQPPPMGKGLTLVEQPAVPTDPPAPPPAEPPPVLDIVVQDNGQGAPIVTGADACKVAAKGARRCTK